MGKYLVIVESPTKAKTISRILGKDYEVTSSMGHLVDLSPKSLSINIEKDFSPRYKIIPGKEKIIKLLKDKAKKKDIVYLATDPDREGEAIGWHIKNKLSKSAKKFLRVIFHEITEEAIHEAFQSPKEIDMDRVNAQKVRRILDRIVGYLLSPLLWRKIARGLSAGRVQSVALKFIVEKEKDIKKFSSKTTYGIEAILRSGHRTFKAKLLKFENKKSPFEEENSAKQALEKINAEKFFVKSVSGRDLKRKPPPPFTTSLLQQEAFNRLNFSSQKTMLVAQKLYEGIQVEDTMVGLITYMRTDSFAVSDKAKKEVKNYINEVFGENYLPLKDYKYKEKKGAQLAHEAIRPTSVFRTPESLEQSLPPDLLKLYGLIWKRFLASFMEEATIRLTKIKITADGGEFLSEGKKIAFDGFQKVSGKDMEIFLPPLKEKDELIPEELKIVEHKTKPPARFTDASLVKLLEEKGIGRPSTYAPTIFTLIKRNYVHREKGHFIPTELGFKVCELLLEHFEVIMEEDFTAKIEEKLDDVEDGKLDGVKILQEFYPPFKDKIDKAKDLIKKYVEVTKEKCPQCGRFLVVKWSRKGKFLSCAGFPECKYAKGFSTKFACPDCKEGKLIERRNRRGQRFYGCTRFPECRYTSRDLPEEQKEQKEGKD